MSYYQTATPNAYDSEAFVNSGTIVANYSYIKRRPTDKPLIKTLRQTQNITTKETIPIRHILGICM